MFGFVGGLIGDATILHTSYATFMIAESLGNAYTFLVSAISSSQMDADDECGAPPPAPYSKSSPLPPPPGSGLFFCPHEGGS
ncbi:hypothetical protein [Mesorhizobium dulcispinae]|uniref:hypothetical protein n=1 Tax=Mesorhizobium dulcispinae TaxID=3072316 RepID=UPI002A23FEAE|nr:hypothetical protein [Mesorhizobium sp. VK23D]